MRLEDVLRKDTLDTMTDPQVNTNTSLRLSFNKDTLDIMTDPQVNTNTFLRLFKDTLDTMTDPKVNTNIFLRLSFKDTLDTMTDPQVITNIFLRLSFNKDTLDTMTDPKVITNIFLRLSFKDTLDIITDPQVNTNTFLRLSFKDSGHLGQNDGPTLMRTIIFWYEPYFKVTIYEPCPKEKSNMKETSPESVTIVSVLRALRLARPDKHFYFIRSKLLFKVPTYVLLLNRLQ